MLRYVIVEISGRQYKIEPNQEVEVDYLGEKDSLECDKVLLLADEVKINVGSPYLKEKLVLDVLKTEIKPKIRVATFKSKANYRRVKGSRRKMSVVKLQNKSREK